MRFFLVISVWVIIIGGVFLYTSHKDRKTPTIRPAPSINSLTDRLFSLEITPTFDLVKDPFALTTKEDASSLEVRVNGREMHVAEGAIQAGQVIRVEKIGQLNQGPNEIFLQASPPVSDTSKEHGLRVKVLEGASVVAETTLWNSSGALVAGSLHFNLTNEEKAHEH